MQSYQKRSEYTFEERKIIVDYIIDRNCYNGLRGNSFWQEMEDKQILQRTWQSLKEHFKKKIIDVIHTFEISEEEKRLFRDGWQQSKKGGYRRTVKRPRYDRGRNQTSDDENGTASKMKSTQDNNNYEITDSDSSTQSFPHTKSKEKMIQKSRSYEATRARSPSEFNFFSDEDDEISQVQLRTNQVMDENSSEHFSPNLLGDFSEKPTTLPSSSKNKNVSTNRINTKFNKSSVENFSDSDEDTVVYVPVNKSGKKKMFTSNNNKKSSNENFSLAEDMKLINFIKLDKSYLQRRNELEIYTYFHEINPDSKPPEQLKDRFLNHIFPNICKYTDFTNEEMCQFYEDAGVDIPNNLKALLEKSPKLVEEINNDFQTNICGDEIDKNSINCLYSHITLNGQSHMFVSDVDKSNNSKSFIELLSKKFKIAPEYIHNADFVSVYLMEQINKFRSSICKKFENIIRQNLPKDDINIEEIFSGLEVCFQSISPNDDDETSSADSESSCESSDETKFSQEIDTQDFNPMEMSTPLSKEHSFGPFRIDPEIMKKEIQIQREENLFAFLGDHNYSTEIPQIEIKVEPDLLFSSPSISLNQSFEPEIQEQVETVHFDSDATQIQIKVEPDLNDYNTTESLNNTLCSEIIEEPHQQIEENDSQFLEAIATQDSTDIRNALARMVDNNYNNSIDLPPSDETYYTAPNFSQDVR